MKKITLTAIIIFLLVIIVAFIGSTFAATKEIQIQPTQNTNIINIKNNNTETNMKSIINTLKNKSNETKNTTSITSNKTDHINPPNTNIKNLIFNLEQASKDTFTIDEVSNHNSKDDCYHIINNKVYDVSSYINHHPGGSKTIISRCGKEVTGIFAQIHSNRAWDLLKEYKIGIITTTKQDTTPQILTAISDALKKTNPNAEIIKVSPTNNFYVAKIIYNKKLYEIHIDNNGQIIKEEMQHDESNWSLWENDNDDK